MRPMSDWLSHLSCRTNKTIFTMMHVLAVVISTVLLHSTSKADPVVFYFMGTDNGDLNSLVCPTCTAMGSFTIDSSLLNGSTYQAIPFADITSFSFTAIVPTGTLNYTLSDISTGGVCVGMYIGKCIFVNSSISPVQYLGSTDGFAVIPQGIYGNDFLTPISSTSVNIQGPFGNIDYDGTWTVGAPLPEIGTGLPLGAFFLGLVWWVSTRSRFRTTTLNRSLWVWLSPLKSQIDDCGVPPSSARWMQTRDNSSNRFVAQHRTAAWKTARATSVTRLVRQPTGCSHFGARLVEGLAAETLLVRPAEQSAWFPEAADDRGDGPQSMTGGVLVYSRYQMRWMTRLRILKLKVSDGVQTMGLYQIP
jgi:hypothetical protein